MVKKYIRNLFLMLMMLMAGQSVVTAQQALSAEEIEQYSSDAEKLVSFLQFTFNTIGSPDVPVKEKDVIINQSFSKFFVDDQVQIEDDLDENREVPINKDVQAYLKDIDFFFDSVQFKFDIENIEHQINDKNQLFFKVTLNRNLKGVTVMGDTVDNNRTRYIEINLDNEEKDLKIASIYTTKLNEKQELRKWWNELPQPWKDVLGADIVLYDTIRMKDVVWFNDSLAKLNYLVKWKMSRDTLSYESQDSLYVSLSDSTYLNVNLFDRQVRKITKLDTINISGNSGIISLEPLTKLDDLKRIDCSHTFVNELMPLRNLTQLESLNCAHTAVHSLDALKYSTNLQDLIIDNTLVDELAPAVNFTSLKKLSLNHTAVDSLHPISQLNNLRELQLVATPVNSLDSISGLTGLGKLDFSETSVSNLQPLSGMKNLSLLKFDDTPVADLSPLKSLSALNILYADKTRVSDLSPLDGLQELRKVYCDKANVSRTEALQFMEDNPNVLVVYESADLVDWWHNMSAAWHEVFADNVSMMRSPSKEELHRIIKIKKLDIAGNKQIKTLGPLSNLSQLTELDCRATGISDLSPLSNLRELRVLNFSDTKVDDLEPLRNLTKLEKISFDGTQVKGLLPLMDHQHIKNIYCDQSPVIENEIVEFMYFHPECLVVYQTAALEAWWESLPEVWKLLAEKFTDAGTDLNREQLQLLANIRVLKVSDFPGMDERSLEIKSLQYLDKMIFLEELRFTNTSVTSLEPLRGRDKLKVLVCNNNPIASLEPLSEVRNLEVLDVQNTPIESLEFLAGLHKLRKLNCSGTQIKKLDGLENLNSLQQLDCYNTSIRRLDELEYVTTLTMIRCYNTRIPERRIDKFKADHPTVEIVYY